MGINKELTPKKIVEELNKYIISQDEAKKNVAISLRNRDRRKMIEDENLRKEITPKNIILIHAILINIFLSPLFFLSKTLGAKNKRDLKFRPLSS